MSLILRHFVAAEVYEAMCQLAVSVGAEKPGSHRNTADRSAGELYAGELHDTIKELTAKNNLPKIVVTSVALPMVPLATLICRDEVSISARLDSLETGLKKLTECVNSANLGGARVKQPLVQVSPVAPSGNDPSFPGPSTAHVEQGHGLGDHRPAVQVDGHGQVQSHSVSDRGHLAVPNGQAVSFANIAAKGGAGGGRTRLGSIGEQQKRDIETDKNE